MESLGLQGLEPEVVSKILYALCVYALSFRDRVNNFYYNSSTLQTTDVNNRHMPGISSTSCGNTPTGEDNLGTKLSRSLNTGQL